MKIRREFLMKSVILASVYLAGCSTDSGSRTTEALNSSTGTATYGTKAPSAATAPAPVLVPEPAPVPSQPVARRQIPEPVRGLDARDRDDSPRYVTRKRSKKKSAVIVGGSAAGGAAIGALAGGGKGAAIGALAGGLGGLIYDRNTHKKRERVR